MNIYSINRAFLIFIIIGLTGFSFQLAPIPKSARVYPFVLLIISYLLSISLFIRPCTKVVVPDKYEWIKIKGTILRILYFLFSTLAYILCIPRLGYLLSTLLFISGVLFYYRTSSTKTLLTLPVLLTLSIYLFFSKFLQIYLPEGIWYKYWILFK